MVTSSSKEEFLDELMLSVKRCKMDSYTRKEVIIPYTVEGCKETEMQFALIIKPEVFFTEEKESRVIIQKVLESIELYEVKLDALYVMNGPYLKENHLIEEQYSILNKGARFGINSLNGISQDTIRQKYSGMRVMGAYEFLEMHPEVTATRLEKISHERGSEKEGNGLYIFPYYEYNVAIINAFHPHQVEHFYDEKNCMIVLLCSSETDYKVLQDNLVGNYNPEKASKGSLRNFIYENKYENKYENNVDIGSTFYNCFHLSPSPLEGMFAVCRYCSSEGTLQQRYENTVLGKMMLSQGYTLEEIEKIKQNPYLKSKGITLFDLLESIPETTSRILYNVEMIRTEAF